MTRGSVDQNFLFTLGELYRLLRVYADKEASRFGITRAQWAVLAKVERSEGMKQSELAELLEMQPITLTRLIDKLCDNDWIERRSDASDRRVKRLHLRKAGRQLLGKMSGLKSELTANALEGINPADAHRLLTQLETIKENVRNAIQTRERNKRVRSNAMADQVLKFQPEQKIDSGKPTKKAGTDPRRRLVAGLRRYRRFLLMVVLPIVVAIAGFTFYLNGGRYIGTDDAYVGAQKVLVTPDISGKIEKVVVKEGQIVKQGDELFEIDPVPFRLAVDEAKAQLMQAQSTYDNLRANIKIYGQMLDLAQQGIDLKQRDVERKQALVKNNFGSQLDLDNASNALVTAGAQAQFIKQQLSNAKMQLLGDPELPLERFPPYAQAKAKLDEAQRNLDHTVLRAPMAGVATQVDQIQLGRFVAAGTPVFSIIDVAHPWVDANPKESDLTYVTAGQPVTLEVDAFPNHVFKGKIGSLSPGTGAQFAILPPQNATGNFVKVVQRVPVRIYFDETDNYVKKLKAGMSVYATIDTGHQRSLAGLFGLSRDREPGQGLIRCPAPMPA